MVHLKTSGKIILVIFSASLLILVVEISQLSIDTPPPSRIQSRRTFSVADLTLEKDVLEANDKFEKPPLSEFLEGNSFDDEKIYRDEDYEDKSDIDDLNLVQVNKINRQKETEQKQNVKQSKISINQIMKLDGSNCSFILKEDSLVRNCITGDPIAVKVKKESMKELEVPVKYSHESVEERKKSFKKVFDTRAWGHSWDSQYHGLNASGRGATLDWAVEATATLHVIVNQLKQQTGKNKIKVLDIPCGDMQWMPKFLRTRDDIDYTGIDIVPDLIDDHLKKYRSESWKFRLVDVLDTQKIEQYDLIFCRMLMQHLYFADVLKLLHIFSKSGSKYLLTTTFVTTSMNDDLYMDDNPGRVRPLNLQLPPISLPPPLCVQRDGPGGSVFEGWSHQLGLWKLPVPQLTSCDYIYYISLRHSQFNIYSCSQLKEVV